MWPFKNNRCPNAKEMPPAPTPVLWDWNTGLGQRLSIFLAQNEYELYSIAHEAGHTLKINFDRVGFITVDLSHAPDGSQHWQWGRWTIYDPYEGQRIHDLPVFAQAKPFEITVITSLAEQGARGFIIPADDQGNTFLIEPTAIVPTPEEFWEMKNNPGSRRVAVGVGQRPKVYSYFVGNLYEPGLTKAAVRRQSWQAFLMWLKDPWGRYRQRLW